MKRRFLILLMATAATLSLMACSEDVSQTTPTENEIEEDIVYNHDIEEELLFLTKNEWAYYNPTIGEAETLTFGKDGTFFYNCECGEPIGDSDLYDMWKYDADNKTLYMTTSYKEDKPNDVPIELLRNDEYRIVVKINGEIKAFEKYDDYEKPNILDNYMSEMEGYSSYLTFNELKDGVLTVSPQYYDGDVKEHRDLKHDENIADDVQIKRIEIHSVVKENGDSTNDIKYEDMTMGDLEAEMKDSSSGGFVWYNDDLEIVKIIIYGENIIFE